MSKFPWKANHSLSVSDRPRLEFTPAHIEPPNFWATDRAPPDPLNDIERWRYECPKGHSDIRSLRGGDAIYCKSCDFKWELNQLLDKKTGETVL